jgi:hypothetical protein
MINTETLQTAIANGIADLDISLGQGGAQRLQKKFYDFFKNSEYVIFSFYKDSDGNISLMALKDENLFHCWCTAIFSTATFRVTVKLENGVKGIYQDPECFKPITLA